MKRPRSRLRCLVELAVFLALAAAWAVTLRPTSLGGPATFIVIRGDSMLPGFHTGDLVILRAAPSYGVGDVIGYRVPDGDVGAGHVVVHRIVGGDSGAGFTMEGDNNPAPDPWLPKNVDVAGKLWVWFPGVGLVISWAHQPATAGALAVSLLVIFVLSRESGGRLGRPVRRKARIPDATPGSGAGWKGFGDV